MRMTARRLVALVALLLVFIATSTFPAPAHAQKTVHVKEYKRKDGTIVKAHDRKAPASKGATSSSSGAGSSTGSSKAANGATLTPAAMPLALKLKSPLPNHIDGFVIASLASGATIRLRSQDIDYEKTAVSPNRVVIRPETFMLMNASDGRAYFNLTFSNRYAVTAWQDDVDLDAMRPRSATTTAESDATIQGMAMATYSRLTEGMTVEEVTKILGFEPVEESRAEIAGAKTVLYKWKRDESVIVVMFKDGQLFSKLPFGLR
jgi:hypothetical protein